MRIFALFCLLLVAAARLVGAAEASPANENQKAENRAFATAIRPFLIAQETARGNRAIAQRMNGLKRSAHPTLAFVCVDDINVVSVEPASL
jgi:hypothetical protein